MGLGGVTLPVSETGIALSLLVIGLLVTWRVQMPASVGVTLIAVFAFCHGHAHGSESPLNVPGLSSTV